MMHASLLLDFAKPETFTSVILSWVNSNMMCYNPVYYITSSKGYNENDP